MELPVVDRMLPFYTPSDEVLSILSSRTWICSYSGGKDSTALVTWIEWLRRSRQIEIATPRLVLSDTGVEFPFLNKISRNMMRLLKTCGWQCEVVKPLQKEKLYCQIFGRGVTPIYPGIRNMRWCTKSTKLAPMSRFAKTLGEDVLQLSGVRWGESKVRDGKLKKSVAGCSAGGECGLPNPDKPQRGVSVYGPIINWKTCQVVDWLQGGVSSDVYKVMKDFYPLTRSLMDVYEVRVGDAGLGVVPPKVSALRFGCIGCPAIGRDKLTSRQINDNPAWKHLKHLYALWEECRQPQNRLPPKGNMKLPGPMRMEARQRLFKKLMQIQEDSGVALVSRRDIAFIHKCWEDGIYPRGWGPEDEKRLA
jgi:DNA sulfur modification protein DndC